MTGLDADDKRALIAIGAAAATAVLAQRVRFAPQELYTRQEVVELLLAEAQAHQDGAGLGDLRRLDS